jgi:hypothetical protein
MLHLGHHNDFISSNVSRWVGVIWSPGHGVGEGEGEIVDHSILIREIL